MILQSRMNNHNISEGENSHEIVINRLIELMIQQKENSSELIKNISLLISNYDVRNNQTLEHKT